MLLKEESCFIKLSKSDQLNIIRILIEYDKCYVTIHQNGKIDISTACLIDNEEGKENYIFERDDFDFSNAEKYITSWFSLTQKYCKEMNDFGVKTAGEIYKAECDYVAELVWRRWNNKFCRENK